MPGSVARPRESDEAAQSRCGDRAGGARCPGRMACPLLSLPQGPVAMGSAPLCISGVWDSSKTNILGLAFPSQAAGALPLLRGCTLTHVLPEQTGCSARERSRLHLALLLAHFLRPMGIPYEPQGLSRAKQCQKCGVLRALQRTADLAPLSTEHRG